MSKAPALWSGVPVRTGRIIRLRWVYADVRIVKNADLNVNFPQKASNLTFMTQMQPKTATKIQAVARPETSV